MCISVYTYQQKLEYAKKLKRLHELYVIKNNIHLTYKYKNQNKAVHNVHSLQDKIINSIIDDAVYGNANAIKNIDSTIEKLMTSTLENERKRIHHQNDKYVNRAVELNSERYTKILTNRINTEAIKLERKIESELRSGIHNGLSEAQTRNVLQEKYQDTAKARIRNIIRDSVHTNESNISFINALNEGYNYKVWMNGRGKGKVRAWHRAKFISPVPIEDYFDIYGSYHAQLMYPGDLYGGAENVANCRCWLRYTNRRPESLGKTPNTYNIPNTSYLSTQNNTRNTANNGRVKVKPFENIRTRISTTTKKIPSKIKTKIKSTREKIKNKFPKKDKTWSQANQSPVNDVSENYFEIDKKSVKNKLKQELPKDISSESIDYLVKRLEKRSNAEIEYGTIFNYENGKQIGEEFEGTETSVLFNYPDTFERKLATQHNHTSIGFHAPSGDDFEMVMSQTWSDYAFILSKKEIWVIEARGYFDNDVQTEVGFFINKGLHGIKQEVKKDTNISKDSRYCEIQKRGSEFVKEFINQNKQYNIKVYRVIL